MKTIEEKARAYDEAIRKLRGMMPNWERLSYNGKTFLQDLIYIIPELAESEDEKIKVAPQNTVKEMEEKLLLQKAVSVYGTIAQTDMAIEEMGELIVAINHYRRGRVEMDAVKEEIADVMIAMKQLAIIYGESGVEIFSEKKMQRLEQRLKDK